MESSWHLIQAWLLQALGKGLASDKCSSLVGMLRTTLVPSIYRRKRRVRRGKAQRE